MSKNVVNLLDKAVYGMAQVDRLLALNGGTAKRWIDGYSRGGKTYPPVVRVEATGDELVTWGEFVEARLLSEYRNAGVPIVRMRPAVEQLREQLNTRYPLALAHPFLDVEGQDLVQKAQERSGLEKQLHIVVVRNGQLMLAPEAERFVQSVDYDAMPEVRRLHPSPDNKTVVMDPLRQFGEPVVRSVRTELIAEQIRAGDSIAMIASLYELPPEAVEAALRLELGRAA